MDNIVDSLNKAYEKFVLASASVIESKESAGGQKASLTDAALENFKEKWELFRVACDQAEEFVESVKQRIGSECLVDEATGLTTASGGGQTAAASGAATSLPPISAVRLEQMSRAVRWLVLELQRGSGVAPGSVHSSSTGFDTRFAEDSTQ
ncbi:PREDICTED: mediator of RNA polymerase II transcription subunit 32-like [Camelina sativa]|uniref:Mediator of RNA polymerase II transcription subunit 32-like n=1 Tax=Camelina sativa TaxID=90675 RepID=A0ABM1RD53_CAMSA|nr:PREDICTED: mediator of RNA polymerase II transcription subunit 32-like [Camelina sativa]